MRRGSCGRWRRASARRGSGITRRRRGSLIRPASVDHSKYSNRVAGFVDALGVAVIHGVENAGTYVATVEAESGHVMKNEVWRR